MTRRDPLGDIERAAAGRLQALEAERLANGYYTEMAEQRKLTASEAAGGLATGQVAEVPAETPQS